MSNDNLNKSSQITPEIAEIIDLKTVLLYYLNVMNISALARQLRVDTNKLKECLPQMGIDIGQKAIKIDDKIAQRIIRSWPIFIRRINEENARKKEQEKIAQAVKEVGEEVKIPNIITVRDLAEKIHLPINTVLKELMKNGVLATMNEKIDFDTAAIIGEDLGMKIVLDENKPDETVNDNERIKDILHTEKLENMVARPPVIVVMGHVDHGKTKLLDAIRKTNIMEQEAGGITQHIGAYQITKNGRKITFIDTPGHEAFTAMRSRGAKIADIAILVVAADDSIKPQTLEAIKIIEKHKLPMIVAINKIDKPEADIERVKRDLAQLNYLPEDWGGKTICAPISAKQNLNIDQLLELVLLTADMDKENITANPNGNAAASVIESHVDKGAGVVSTIIIQNGTLRRNDNLCINGIIYGKVKSMRDWLNNEVLAADPGMPVEILGLKIAPAVGDIIEANCDGIKIKNIKKLGQNRAEETNLLAANRPIDVDDKSQKFNLIIKTDVLGSAEAIIESLAKIETADFKINVVAKGLGNITESEIERAITSNSYLIGFNVKATPQAELLAGEKNITVHTFKIIYELLDFLKQEIESKLDKEIIEEKIGEAKVLKIFKTEKKGQIVGCKVTSGKIIINVKVNVFHDNRFAASGKITTLQSGRQDVHDVMENQECGLYFAGNPIIVEGDKLEIVKVEEKIKKIA